MNLFLRQPLIQLNQTLLGSALIITILFSITTTAAHAEESAVSAPTIIGGEEVSDDAYPWAVALFKDGSGPLESRHFCGGTLIDPEWVLTAAHCTFRGSAPRVADTINALVGSTDLNDSSGLQVEISEIIRHPDYVRATANKDMALLRLAQPVDHPTIALGDAAQLSTAQSDAMVVLGWGTTEDVSRSATLRHVNVPLVNRETCRTAYATFNYLINESMVCAGYAAGGKDACTGDSGGPLVAPAQINDEGDVLEWALVGVVSWGRGCAQMNAYGVYANVGLLSTWIAGEQATVDGRDDDSVTGVSVETSFIFIPIIQ